MARLLVVDDEIEVCDFLLNYFTEKGHSVFSATGGEEALQLVREKLPDLLLLDIRMPGISGLEVLRRLRNEGSSSAVVMVTAIGDIEIFKEAKRLGAADYVTKPFRLDYLDSVVRFVSNSLNNKD